jgi:hypothetical protein
VNAPFSGPRLRRPSPALPARWLLALAATGALAIVLGGCGGGPAKAYTVAATKACLEKAGARIEDAGGDTDFVASAALGGALGAKLAMNHVTIAFGRDAAEAGLLLKAYRKYGNKAVVIDQVLEQQRNAVLLWAGAPTPQDADVVHRCLKS